jgi:ATP-binding cassette subfamily B (MDR/TAP) protein 1
VRFSYPTRHNVPVLQGLSFKIQRGERIGIVGASGCGKTTVIPLLERFYEIGSGEILQNLDINHHLARIGLVSQNTTLYQGSICDNVLVGVSPDYQGISDGKVIKACKDENCWTKLPLDQKGDPLSIVVI